MKYPVNNRVTYAECSGKVWHPIQDDAIFYRRWCWGEIREKRQRCKGKRTQSLQNFLTVGNNRIRMCKKFFIATLACSDKFIRNSMTKRNDMGIIGATDQRGKHTPWNATDNSEKERVRRAYSQFPKNGTRLCKKAIFTWISWITFKH